MTSTNSVHRLLSAAAESSRKSERGQAGGIEVIPFGILTFVVGAILIASAWAVIDAKLATVSAAREAARTYVESSNAESARQEATSAAQNAMSGHGRGDVIQVSFDEPSGYVRCGRVTVEVSSEVPAVPLPWIGGLGAITVTSSHSERIDPYRDGVPGAAQCPP